MIVVAAITLCLILVGIAAFIYGTIRLAKYAFRISSGRGVAAILFPPYTFYFAFAELEEEDKAIPTASWMFGLVVTVLLSILFFQPLQLLLAGEFDKLSTNPGEAARSEYVEEGADVGLGGAGASSDEESTESADTGSTESADTGGGDVDAAAASPDAGTDADGS